MNLSSVRGLLEGVGRRRQAWGGSTSSSNASSVSSSNRSITTQQSDEDLLQQEAIPTVKALSDHEMLERARAAHKSEDFASLAAGPQANGPWKRVEAMNDFVVFRRQIAASNNQSRPNDLEVMCAGRLDASLEEVSSILQLSSETEHNAAMIALYPKSFIFGSYEREVPCAGNQESHDDDANLDIMERLAVKTKSFARTTILGRNEQWCYFDFFKRKTERDGFTILKRALPPSELTPGRIPGEKARVDQLHGLNASYLVDRLPNDKGLRVVFHAWFEPLVNDSGSSSQSALSHSSNSTSSLGLRFKAHRADSNKHQAQLRRLLAMAHGIMNLPELIRRRRFGVQTPADLGAIHVSNSRCPCCTHSLASVRSSLVTTATAIARRSLASLKTDTRRCYLCGYLVCLDCWSTKYMESVAGRVAAIVVCTRCHANVEACEYSEVFAGTAAEREKHRGPPRVVEDSNNSATALLLTDFLSTSLLDTAAGGPEHAALLVVIRTLLRQNEDGLEDDNSDPEWSSKAVTEVGEIISDQQQLPALDACKLGNSAQRSYPLDLPADPTADVPHFPIPSNEAARLAAAEAAGLLQLADQLAPATSPSNLNELTQLDVHDLDLLCQLAAKMLDCSHAFVAIMGATHEHFIAENRPLIAGTAAPREHTTCQHALMSPHPFMAVHHEADVRLHKLDTTRNLHIRSYVGFPLKIRDLTVGMFCCLDSKPRAEITRTQYATMQRLATAATSLLLVKACKCDEEIA